ncbi:malonate decarboxylase holo-[acyl-carrier-protein] synthase [uncultured Sphaerotilus sp.]|uniref:malonate decarboxylase holo-[acyl-carrier-protein] synthase n=1 Tax=uncultured Sphaerotilus sp. TaxID=474984 RepID=UPI0030CA35C1
MASELQGLQRHRLVRLTPEGWAGVQSGDREPLAQAALAHWASRDLPLVVTRQRVDEGEQVALGLPAPTCWGRLRLALSVPAAALRDPHGFPEPAAITPLLAPPMHAAWTTLTDRLATLGMAPQVYGSHGWQVITGLAYLREGSDLDLWLPVRDAAQADAAATLLDDADWRGPRLDGEIGLPDGAAVAWREWQQWRAGRADAVLVKHGTGVRLERGSQWLTRN